MILNDNSTQQINTLVIQLQNKITNLTNESRKLNKEISELDSEISDLEKRISSNENDADNNIDDLNNEISNLERRVSSLANDASAMNTEISANTEAINGKADKNHTHTKSQITDFPTSLKNPNALTVNGKTYDGSSAVEAGVQTVENGGTGATTAKGAFESLANGLLDDVNPIDTEHIIFKNTAGTNWGLYTLSTFWNYIKGKISSVLGLTKDNYGGKASTAGTADYSRNMYYQYLDLSALDKTKFYPLVCYSGNDFAEVAICSESGIGSMEYNQNRIHFDISTQGWSDLRPTLNIREYACYENNEITIGCIGRGLHNGAWAIWLRGGLHYTCFSRDSDLSLHTSDYTFGDEVYTVGTNYYGGSNTNVGIMFTPQSTITEGAYSSRPITAPNITSLEQRVAALESKA